VVRRVKKEKKKTAGCFLRPTPRALQTEGTSMFEVQGHEREDRSALRKDGRLARNKEGLLRGRERGEKKTLLIKTSL